MDKKPSLKWYKTKNKPKKEDIYTGTWESALLFKARTNTLEVNERRKKWGGENDKCEKCAKRGENIVETLEHVITECGEYTDERNRVDQNISNKIGHTWERKKREEDRGLKTMLGLENTDKEVVGYTKKFLKEMWIKRNKKERQGGGAAQSEQEHSYSRRGGGS